MQKRNSFSIIIIIFYDCFYWAAFKGSNVIHSRIDQVVPTLCTPFCMSINRHSYVTCVPFDINIHWYVILQRWLVCDLQRFYNMARFLKPFYDLGTYVGVCGYEGWGHSLKLISCMVWNNPYTSWFSRRWLIFWHEDVNTGGLENWTLITYRCYL